MEKYGIIEKVMVKITSYQITTIVSKKRITGTISCKIKGEE